jgi:hypothetical protein
MSGFYQGKSGGGGDLQRRDDTTVPILMKGKTDTAEPFLSMDWLLSVRALW